MCHYFQCVYGPHPRCVILAEHRCVSTVEFIEENLVYKNILKQVSGWMDGSMDGWMDRWMDGWMDKELIESRWKLMRVETSKEQKFYLIRKCMCAHLCMKKVRQFWSVIVGYSFSLINFWLIGEWIDGIECINIFLVNDNMSFSHSRVAHIFYIVLFLVFQDIHYIHSISL